MKKVSEHLGQIIVALAAIALLVTAVVVFRAPLGGFFGNVVDKTTSIGQEILANMEDWELGAFGGSGGSGGSGATDSDGPNLVFDQELGSTSHNPLAVESGSFTLSGMVTDKNGVASLIVNGDAVTVGVDGSWSTTLALTQNVVTEINVVATDSEGNTTTKKGYVGYIVYREVLVAKDNYAAEIGYTSTTTDLVIPATFQKDGQWYKVVGLASNAFSNRTNLTSVVIPDSVTSIKGSAFSGCTNLTSVVIPDSVTSIEGAAFTNCKSLTSVVIPDSLSTLTASVFKGCTSLTNVVIGNGVTKISSSTFGDCTSLTSVKIGNSVTEIYSDAFRNCTSLTSVGPVGSVASVEVPNSVVGMGFMYCTGLTNVVFPDSITSIYGFRDCSSLISVTIPQSVTSINYPGFINCKSLTNITFKGTMAEWNAITKDSQWKSGVPATEVVCSDGTVTL